ncbi:hypothetical protein JW868_03395 [Candidatus Woesearchaeota archaeon]|nr:hypothetical protein [Candidatus Woesearchaeota archaeon]
MQKVTFGDGKGYLFKKEDFDNRFKKRFPFLKDKHLSFYAHAWWGTSWKIDMIVFETIEKDKAIITKPYEKSSFCFSNPIFKELFGINEAVTGIIPVKKVCGNKFLHAESEDDLLGIADLYYFVCVEDYPDYQYLADVKPVTQKTPS